METELQPGEARSQQMNMVSLAKIAESRNSDTIYDDSWLGTSDFMRFVETLMFYVMCPNIAQIYWPIWTQEYLSHRLQRELGGLWKKVGDNRSMHIYLLYCMPHLYFSLCTIFPIKHSTLTYSIHSRLTFLILWVWKSPGNPWQMDYYLSWVLLSEMKRIRLCMKVAFLLQN